MNAFRQFYINPVSDEDVKECQTIEGMRKRIQRYSRHDQLTRAVMDAAYHRGLSGEDTMTMLAFEALKRLEVLMDAELHRINISPAPPMIFSKDALPGGAETGTKKQ